MLGAFSVPAGHLEQTAPTGERRWRYFSKAGLVVRGGRSEPVRVTVPRAWRDRVAIAWGYGGNGVFSELVFPACPGRPTQGFAFSGGFYLRAKVACVPLRFTVARRSAVVRFGVGRRCTR